jgi:hypothetical protein
MKIHAWISALSGLVLLSGCAHDASKTVQSPTCRNIQYEINQSRNNYSGNSQTNPKQNAAYHAKLVKDYEHYNCSQP